MIRPLKIIREQEQQHQRERLVTDPIASTVCGYHGPVVAEITSELPTLIHNSRILEMIAEQSKPTTEGMLVGTSQYMVREEFEDYDAAVDHGPPTFLPPRKSDS